jgi:hypothetical protein
LRQLSADSALESLGTEPPGLPRWKATLRIGSLRIVAQRGRFLACQSLKRLLILATRIEGHPFSKEFIFPRWAEFFNPVEKSLTSFEI